MNPELRNVTRSALLRIAIVAGLLLLITSLALPAIAQTGGGYDLTWNTIDGGGGTSIDGGGTIVLDGTVGQSDAGVLTGGDYELCGGFWCTDASTPIPTPTNT